MGISVGWTLILSPLLVLLFIWLHVSSKDSPFFLLALYSSLFFIGLATLLMLYSNVEGASKRSRRIFYGLIAITIVIIVGVAFSIASVPAGGTHHYSYLAPADAKINLNYDGITSGKTGYRGRWEQHLLEVNYPIGASWVDYELYGVQIDTDKSIYANLTVWFSLEFWPNGKYYRSIYDQDGGTTLHNGTESYISFRHSTFTIFWGADDPELRDRLDRGYAVDLVLEVELESIDYGDLSVTIPFYSGVHIDDVEVSSQLEDGTAILFCGIFAAALSYIPARSVKPKIEARLGPMLGRISRSLGPETKGFLKECIKCRREIPIASEECPYCGTSQLEK
jgi:hypothetical protein